MLVAPEEVNENDGAEDFGGSAIVKAGMLGRRPRLVVDEKTHSRVSSPTEAWYDLATQKKSFSIDEYPSAILSSPNSSSLLEIFRCQASCLTRLENACCIWYYLEVSP